MYPNNLQRSDSKRVLAGYRTRKTSKQNKALIASASRFIRTLSSRSGSGATSVLAITAPLSALHVFA